MTVSFVNPAAHEIMVLIERMIKQYHSHFAAMLVARDPRSDSLAPQVEKGQIVPIFRLPDGPSHISCSSCQSVETKKLRRISTVCGSSARY
jgi:hypothetical protein